MGIQALSQTELQPHLPFMALPISVVPCVVPGESFQIRRGKPIIVALTIRPFRYLLPRMAKLIPVYNSRRKIVAYVEQEPARKRRRRKARNTAKAVRPARKAQP